MKTFKTFLLLFIALPFGTGAVGQNRDAETCNGPIYTGREVARRAKVIENANLEVIYRVFGRDLQAHAVVETVLCRSGRVTDIKVIEISPPEIKDFLVAAVSQIRFKPAEMNWHTVSQRQTFEFHLNDRSDIKAIDPAAAAGRLIESLSIIGQRRITTEQILSWIKTRAGEPFDFDQIQRDFQSVLAKGHFDKLQSRVISQDGLRGGVEVTFEVVELPLIKDVSFEGAWGIERSVFIDELLKRNVDVREGAAFDSLRVETAIRVIKELLSSRGFTNAKVELRVENATVTTVKLVFGIRNE